MNAIEVENENLEKTSPGEKERFLLSSKIILESAYLAGLPTEALEKVDLEWEIHFLDLAYDIASESHKNDKPRRSGRPYFSHPLSVAKVLLEDFSNPTAFKAIVGLLHDVIEDAADPKAKEAELRERFRNKAASLPVPEGLSFGDAKKRFDFMSDFGDMVVDAVVLLSKKRNEDYLSAWEKPLLAFEEAMGQTTETAASFLWWSPQFKMPKLWKQIMKERADAEYFSRFQPLVSDRIFLCVLLVKLADRYDNLCDSDHESVEQIEKICKETEGHYYELADRVDSEIARHFRWKVTQLRELAAEKRAEQKANGTRDRIKKRTTAALSLNEQAKP